MTHFGKTASSAAFTVLSCMTEGQMQGGAGLGVRVPGCESCFSHKPSYLEKSSLVASVFSFVKWA